MRKIKVNAIKGRNLTTGEEVDIGLLGGSSVYSTDEIKVGTWVDGRTIYKKVFISENVSMSEDYYGFKALTLGNFSNLDVDFIIREYGMFHDSSSDMINLLPFQHPETNYGVNLSNEDNKDIKIYGRTSRSFSIVFVAIEYVKAGT